MNKKGAELSLNVIIIAVLVLIVLVVVVIIFSGRIGIFQKGAAETEQPYKASVCDIPGTGRYCSSQCLEGDYEVDMKDFTCLDEETRGTGMCCCCKFTKPTVENG